VFALNSLSTLIHVAHKYVRNIFNEQLEGRNHDGYVIGELIVIGFWLAFYLFHGFTHAIVNYSYVITILGLGFVVST
jgi:hypothetical protein